MPKYRPEEHGKTFFDKNEEAIGIMKEALDKIDKLGVPIGIMHIEEVTSNGGIEHYATYFDINKNNIVSNKNETNNK